MKLWADPFGLPFLNTIHTIALDAAPLTADPGIWFLFAIIPSVAVTAQAYLLFEKGTRNARMALGAVALGLLWGSWKSFRLYNPAFNAFNCGITVIFIHTALKVLEFSLLSNAIVDPRMRAGRPRWLAAIDICFNSRLIGLGSIGLDVVAGPPNKDVVQGMVERHLPKPGARPTTRLGAITRHMVWFTAHYLVCDTILNLIKTTTPQLTSGGQDLLAKFAKEADFVFLPSTVRLGVPGAVSALAAQTLVAIMVWQALSLGYAAAAIITLATGAWEVDAWNVDMFDAPYKAQSMIELWGKRWHQVFRHQFIICSASVLQLFGLPPTHILSVPLSFLFSGLLHAWGSLNMLPVPNPHKLCGFFVLSGVGCAFEVLFKRFTGRRVEGFFGRVWTWAFLYPTARLAADAWLDAGIGGSTLLPPNGPGVLTARLIQQHIFAPRYA